MANTNRRSGIVATSYHADLCGSRQTGHDAVASRPAHSDSGVWRTCALAGVSPRNPVRVVGFIDTPNSKVGSAKTQERYHAERKLSLR